MFKKDFYDEIKKAILNEKEIRLTSKNNHIYYFFNLFLLENDILKINNKYFVVAKNYHTNECLIYNKNENSFYGVVDLDLIDTDFMLKIADNPDELLTKIHLFLNNEEDNSEPSLNPEELEHKLYVEKEINRVFSTYDFISKHKLMFDCEDREFIISCQEYSLDEIISNYLGSYYAREIEKYIVPIIYDVGDNQLCISFKKDETYGQLYFLDHEDYDLTFLAESLDIFFDNLVEQDYC